MVYKSYRAEALFGVNFNENQKDVLSYSISSFARIIEDNDAAPGWWYLNEIIVEAFWVQYKCNPTDRVKVICARLISKGSKKAFQDLEEFKGRNPGRYTVHVQKDSGRIEIKE